jgi:hypothetical protein
MLTGRLPFESDDLFELVRLHRDAEPPPVSELRPDVPAALAAVVAAALAKEQSERPPDGTALLDLLGGADGIGAVVGPAAAEAATLVGQPPVVRAPTRSRRAPLLTAGAVALALVGAGLAWEVGQPADGSSPPATVRAKRPTTAQHLPSTSTTDTPATTLPTTTARTSPTGTRTTTTTPAATRPPATTAPRTASTGATTTAATSTPTTGTTLPTTTTTTPTTDTTTPTTPTTTAATTTDPTAASTAATTTAPTTTSP